MKLFLRLSSISIKSRRNACEKFSYILKSSYLDNSKTRMFGILFLTVLFGIIDLQSVSELDDYTFAICCKIQYIKLYYYENQYLRDDIFS